MSGSAVVTPVMAAAMAGSNYGTNNRLVVPTGVQYDDAGNLVGHSVVGTMSYDGESRMVGATSVAAPPRTATYAYDGEGRRVKRTVGADTTIYIYDAFGQLASEVGTPEVSSTLYATRDHLGSTRLLTDGSGAIARCYDYLPFGEGLAQGRPSCFSVESYQQYPVADKQTVRFTGKERDAETGLDYFGARYMASAQGRFTTPDVIAAHDSSSVEILDYVPHPNDAVSIRSMIPFDASAEEYTYSDSQILNNRSDGSYASLTIQTTPEVTAKVQAFIKEFRSAPPRYRFPLGQTCVTACRAALELAGIKVFALTPAGLWDSLYRQYSPSYRLLRSDGKGVLPPSSYQYGADVGSPRVGDGRSFQKYVFGLLQAQLEAERNKKGYAVDSTITYK